jgi:hypothetical protein
MSALFKVARQINFEPLPAKMQSCFRLGMHMGLGDVPALGRRGSHAADLRLISRKPTLRLSNIWHQTCALVLFAVCCMYQSRGLYLRYVI